MSLRSENTRRTWPRTFLSAVLILLWLMGAALGGPLFGKIDVTAEGIKDDSSPVIVSEDGLAAQAFVPIDADADVGEVPSALSAELRGAVPEAAAVETEPGEGRSA